MREDSLGDRMKLAEEAARTVLPRRMPVILRVDGRAFHSVLAHAAKPFDAIVERAMNYVATRLCNEVQGAQLAYVQSDEVSVLVHGYKRHASTPWFDNQVQKMTSVAASVAATAFMSEWGKPVAFDARVFVLPEADVCNYFVWRQQDAVRNSVQMVARAHFSHRECHQRSCDDLKALLAIERGVYWESVEPGLRLGRCAVRHTFEREGAMRSEWRVEVPPVFAGQRDYVERFLAVEPEDG